MALIDTGPVLGSFGIGQPSMAYNFTISLAESTVTLADALAGGTPGGLPAGGPAAGPLSTAISIGSDVARLAQNVLIGGFSECSGLDGSMDVTTHKEGGRNGAELKFAGAVSWSNITLKRGVTFSDDLWNWINGYAQGRGRRRDGVIVLQNDLHIPLKAWVFRRGMPLKWSGPTLNATSNVIAVEELQIAHEGLILLSPGAALGQFTSIGASF